MFGRRGHQVSRCEEQDAEDRSWRRMGLYGNLWREKPKEEEEKGGRDMPILTEGSALS